MEWPVIRRWARACLLRDWVRLYPVQLLMLAPILLNQGMRLFFTPPGWVGSVWQLLWYPLTLGGYLRFVLAYEGKAASLSPVLYFVKTPRLYAKAVVIGLCHRLSGVVNGLLSPLFELARREILLAGLLGLPAIALFIGLLYLQFRLFPLPYVMAGEPELPVREALARCFCASKGAGLRTVGFSLRTAWPLLLPVLLLPVLTAISLERYFFLLEFAYLLFAPYMNLALAGYAATLVNPPPMPQTPPPAPPALQG